jgi:hypothetical protein
MGRAREPIPEGHLRRALGALKDLASGGVAGAEECVSLIEKALGNA